MSNLSEGRVFLPDGEAAARYDSVVPHSRFTSEVKLALLRRHLLNHEPAYKLAQEAGVDRSTFHRWQRRFLRYSLREGAPAFKSRRAGHHSEFDELRGLLSRLSRTL